MSAVELRLCALSIPMGLIATVHTGLGMFIGLMPEKMTAEDKLHTTYGK